MIDGRTILNVNDDPGNRYAVTRMLELGGFRVIEAVTGGEAVEKTRAELPDCIVLDVNLPDRSGHEVAREIKSDPELIGIPILQLSAISIRPADKVQGLDAGADGYLTMPVEAMELVATVRALIRARLAEDAARAAAARWSSTFAAIGDGVLLLDGDGVVIQANEAAQSFFGRDISGRRLIETIEKDLDRDGRDRMQALLGSADHRSGDVQIGEQWLRIAVDRVVSESGEFGRVLTAADITERRYLEQTLRGHAEKLAEADRRKDEFLAMLAHELRNPLSAISAALHNLREESREADEEWIRKVAVRQVDHLARLVDDLLDLSRVTHGKIRLRQTPVAIQDVLQQVQRNLHHLAELRQQEIVARMPDEPLVVRGDRMRLEQVFSNILHNATKYTQDGGRIEIEARHEGDNVAVSITDNGSGIGEDTLPRIFDTFEQAETSLDRSAGGLGIGLTLVNMLVRMHGGRVEARSAGRGSGSTFVVHLPIATGEAAVETAADGLDEWEEERPQSILLAEDNPDVRELLRVMLERRGHRVESVEDGRVAVERALQLRPDVCLIDIGLPKLDGYEVARHIREGDAEGSIRLIAISGYGREEDRARSAEVGFERHLVKPVRPQALFAAIRGTVAVDE